MSLEELRLEGLSEQDELRKEKFNCNLRQR